MPYRVIKQENGMYYGLLAKELSFAQHSFPELAQQILLHLAKNPDYPTHIAKALEVHEQKVYYHIRKLEASGILCVTKTQEINGSTAKYYSLTAPAFFTRIGDFQKTTKIQQTNTAEEKYLEPFVKDGELHANIITGSPDPHGPEKARSRDGYYGIDLGLFLGKFLHTTPRTTVQLDTEFHNEWKQNLILIGGPVTNNVVAKINTHLPLFFDAKKSNNVYSKITKQEYAADEIGVIQKIQNPFSKEHSILVVAGKRHQGTRAAILAFLSSFEELVKGNRIKPKTFATVVEGVDLDSDGLIDAVEIRE